MNYCAKDEGRAQLSARFAARWTMGRASCRIGATGQPCRHLLDGRPGLLVGSLAFDLTSEPACAADAILHQSPIDALGEDLASGTRFVLDLLRLANQRLQDDVFLALLVNEIAAVYDRRGLQLAVDPAVALPQSRRVQRQVDVDQVVARIPSARLM